MTDYKELYLTLLRASEKAVQTIIAAQQECEEMFISSATPELIIFPELPDSENQPPP